MDLKSAITYATGAVMKLLNTLFGTKQQNAFCFLVPMFLMFLVLVNFVA